MQDLREFARSRVDGSGTLEAVAPPSSDQLLVLAVCTGNICRSPATERLLAARLGPESGVQVRSAGTGALVGHPIHPPMATHLTAAGASVDGFVARQVTEAMLREADLILALTRAHRAALVELAPAVVRRVFTLRELGRLAQDVGTEGLPAGPVVDRLAALVPVAASRRGRVRASRPEDDDVVDPYRRSAAVYTRSFAQLTPAVDAIVRTVRG